MLRLFLVGVAIYLGAFIFFNFDKMSFAYLAERTLPMAMGIFLTYAYVFNKTMAAGVVSFESGENRAGRFFMLLIGIMALIACFML